MQKPTGYSGGHIISISLNAMSPHPTETLSSEMYALNTYRGHRCHVRRVAANARRLFVLVKLEADFRSRV